MSDSILLKPVPHEGVASLCCWFIRASASGGKQVDHRTMVQMRGAQPSVIIMISMMYHDPSSVSLFPITVTVCSLCGICCNLDKVLCSVHEYLTLTAQSTLLYQVLVTRNYVGTSEGDSW